MKVTRARKVITAVMSPQEAAVVARALGRLSERAEPGSYAIFLAFNGKLTDKEYDAGVLQREREARG